MRRWFGLSRASNIVSASTKEGYDAMVLTAPVHAHGHVYSFYLQSKMMRWMDPKGASPSLNLAWVGLVAFVQPIQYFFAWRRKLLRKFYVGWMDRRLEIYAENRSWNVPTMAFLRTVGIGACGTFHSKWTSTAKSSEDVNGRAKTTSLWVIWKLGKFVRSLKKVISFQ